MGDVQGQSLLHLQCNASQDTLSWAQRGAVVTGVDISDEAISFARRLSQDTGIPATFHRADVYDWLEQARQGTDRFDVVFSSYGALVWLSDLMVWAQGIAAVLRPGGRFVVVDFHPFALMFDEQLVLKYPYFGQGQPAISNQGVGDYVAFSGPVLTPSGYEQGITAFRNPHPSHEFAWSLSAIVTALLEAGLTLTTLREYPYANGFKLYGDKMRELPDGRVAMPAGMPDIPLMYGIAART